MAKTKELSDWGLPFHSFEYRIPKTKQTVTVWFPNLATRVCQVIRRRRSFYERDLLEHLYRTVPRGGTIIDVGANIGNHTVYFAKLMARHVIAVEPHPPTQPILMLNCLRNELTNVTCIPAACAEKPYLASMVGGKLTKSDMRVAAMRLDDIVAMHPTLPKVTLIKIDVQGAEMNALRGAIDTLIDHRPHIAVETDKGQAAIREVMSFLGETRYRYVGRFAGWPTHHFAPI